MPLPLKKETQTSSTLFLVFQNQCCMWTHLPALTWHQNGKATSVEIKKVSSQQVYLGHTCVSTNNTQHLLLQQQNKDNQKQPLSLSLGGLCTNTALHIMPFSMYTQPTHRETRGWQSSEIFQPARNRAVQLWTEHISETSPVKKHQKVGPPRSSQAEVAQV